jgi:hypothetical protein
MASSGMNTEPTHKLLPDTEATLQDSLKPLQKAKHETPSVDSALPPVPSVDDTTDAWYEP